MKKILDIALEEFFPVIMILAIIVIGYFAERVGEEPWIIISLLGLTAVMVKARCDPARAKVPDWILLPITTGTTLLFSTLLSMFTGSLFSIPRSETIPALICALALIEGRKFEKTIVSQEIIFQIILLIQIFAVIEVLKGDFLSAASKIPVSAFSCSLILYLKKKQKRV